MKEWFSPSEILAFNQGELPASERSLYRYIKEAGWQSHQSLAKRVKAKGGGWLYHISLLPDSLRARIQAGQMETIAEEKRSRTWAVYEALTKKQKAECKRRLLVLEEVSKLTQAGLGDTAAVQIVSTRSEISASTLFNWRSLVANHPRADWLAALAPSYKKKRASRTTVHPEAWSILKSDFLRPEQPTFSACYRRMKELAERSGWSPIPIERTLRRKLNAEVPCDVQTLAREGRDKAKTLYPAQRRTRKHLHAMQMVNMDGHKFDVFIKKSDGTVGRLYLIALQDLYSNKFIAWRLSPSENKEIVRLVIGDMVENFGIPDEIYLDNGRAFSSKWITGGIQNRFRFKIRDEEPVGLLTTLGVKVHWTTPYSGQSKPIERAFKDLCDGIAKHPYCSGAYTGNSPANQPENHGQRAINEELFRDFVDAQIAAHNAQQGRRSETANGGSFDEAFERSMSDPATIVSQPTRAQKSLWLLAADKVRAKRGNGEIHFYSNRYWSPELTAYAGKPVTVRFDPEDLTESIRVYDIANQFICDAHLIADVRFNDAKEAKRHNANRKRHTQLIKDTQELHRQLSADELARLYDHQNQTKPRKISPSISRIATSNTAAVRAVKEEHEQLWNEELEKEFSSGLHLIWEREE